MTNSVYKSAKLAIYEKAETGEISQYQKDQLLTMLEAKKDETELTPDAIENFFDELSEKYPDLKSDISKLAKKVKNAKSDDEDEDDQDDDDEEATEESAFDDISYLYDYI